uniref:Uncharacterized protein n=1 Tax=Arundo donax TaxID=35708 RepID=A0A0A9D6L1_ARUDO
MQQSSMEPCPRLSISHSSVEILGADGHNHSLCICTTYQQEESRVLAGDPSSQGG